MSFDIVWYGKENKSKSVIWFQRASMEEFSPGCGQTRQEESITLVRTLFCSHLDVFEMLRLVKASCQGKQLSNLS